MPEPIPVVKGEGIYLIDAQGRRYMDAISSWWVTLHGHAHPYIAEKLYEQARTLEQVIFAGFTHEPAVQLAERLLTILPGPFARIFYSDNGSTSTEVAIKMSLQFWWNQGITSRNKILAFRNAYHGDTFGAMSVSDRSVFTLAFHDKLFEVIFIDTPGEQFRPEQLNVPWDEVACFIYEPLVQGAGGMHMYDAASLQALVNKCREHDIVLIADEVMTGFYRTGKCFASAYMETAPDIICLSKGLTGGTLPLGVTACRQKIYDAFVVDDKLKTFFHGHSFTANPLACAAALASLDLLEKEECGQRIAAITEQHKTFIQSIAAEFQPQYIKNTRCLGTIAAFEIVNGKDEYLNNISTVITQQALSRELYIRPLGNTVYLMPPYCITDEQLQYTYEVLRGIVHTLQ